MLQSVLKLAEEKRSMTTSDIFEALHRQRGKPVNPKRVLSILNTLEKHGLIKRSIVSIGNAPRLIWNV